MADKRVEKLGEILIRHGWLKEDGLERILRKQKLSGELMGALLLQEKLVTEEQLAQALSEQFQIPFVALKNFEIDPALVSKFSTSLIVDYKCFPLRQDKGAIIFGITNPLDAWALTKLKTECANYTTAMVLITRSAMNDLLAKHRQYVNQQIRNSLDQNNNSTKP